MSEGQVRSRPWEAATLGRPGEGQLGQQSPGRMRLRTLTSRGLGSGKTYFFQSSQSLNMLAPCPHESGWIYRHGRVTLSSTRTPPHAGNPPEPPQTQQGAPWTDAVRSQAARDPRGGGEAPKRPSAPSLGT